MRIYNRVDLFHQMADAKMYIIRIGNKFAQYNKTGRCMNIIILFKYHK